jgi:toxin ParE1/3/4
MAVGRLEVVFRTDAAADLTEIYRWIYEASQDPITANRYLGRLVAFCEKIGGMARGGRPRDDLLPGLRTFPFERRAVIAYLIVGDRVEITNVFYGGRDYEALYRGQRDDTGEDSMTP